MAAPTRGIAPDLLISQVKNTMPYLFEDGAGGIDGSRYPPLGVLRDFDADPTQKLSHFEYFRLSLFAHYSSCGTPVPTDVDNQIRRKLWPTGLPLATVLQMSNLVRESRHWDFSQVTSRRIQGVEDWSGKWLYGHLGEWFTVAAAAYAALGQYRAPEAALEREQVLAEISDEVHRHAEIFSCLWKAREGVAALIASAYIAHNLGDLDRVIDMWELAPGDYLRLGFYKLSATPYDSDRKLRYRGVLWVAGELYKAPIGGSSMAFENHRHFALRKPRILRSKREFLVPSGPFFDAWGQGVGSNLQGSELQEVIEALVHGWDRLPKTVGYGRALRGIGEVRLDAGIPRKPGMEMTQAKFEQLWAEGALAQMEEIPSRA